MSSIKPLLLDINTMIRSSPLLIPILGELLNSNPDNIDIECQFIFKIKKEKKKVQLLDDFSQYLKMRQPYIYKGRQRYSTQTNNRNIFLIMREKYP